MINEEKPAYVSIDNIDYSKVHEIVKEHDLKLTVNIYMKKLFIILSLLIITNCARNLTPEQKQERMQRQVQWMWMQGLGK
tara:strand:+ start:789 stop:1028 length:240 start_codon:yes stop_codon:yes gene_type:complete